MNQGPFKNSTTEYIAQLVNKLTTMQKIRVQFLGQEVYLEKEMATHTSISAARIPWTEEPGRLNPGGCKSWMELSD